MSKKTIVLLFSVKVIAGVATSLFSYRFFSGNGDHILLNNLGIEETNNLFNKPKLFFNDIFISNYDQYGTILESGNSYWKDLGNNILLKILGFLNLLSNGNYYINSLLLNAVGFMSILYLFNFFKRIYPNSKSSILIGCIFLPSTLYFCSAINKDLLVFTCLNIFIYKLYQIFYEKSEWKKIISLLFSFLFIFLIRNYIGLVLFICTIGLIIFYKARRYFFPIMNSCFGISIILLFGLSTNKYNILKFISDKQAAFIKLGKANTDYAYTVLEPDLGSILQATPSAIRRSYLSPLPLEFRNNLINLLSFELLIYLLLALILFICSKKNTFKNISPFTIYLQIFTFIIFIIIGLTITNAGSVVRYRSIFLPYLIIPIICNINWQKIKKKVLPLS